MKQKFLIFLALIFLIVILIGLNAASYTQKEETPDSELMPNRSTYHVGATGTRAFYDLLAETGRKPVRWQEPPSALFNNSVNKPQTFVIIGPARREFEAEEVEQILRWASEGGKLVIIDREPPNDFVKTTANWIVTIQPSSNNPFIDTDPTNQKQMTEAVSAAKPAQPTIFTAKVNAVQPSRFASFVKLDNLLQEAPPPANVTSSAPMISSESNNTEPPPGTQKRRSDDLFTTPEPTPIKPMFTPTPPVIISEQIDETAETSSLTAPVVHLTNDDKNLLVDVPFGSGKIVFLTDPYIVSNGGINLVDNVQLALNVVASGDGIIAFDEYHQGYGTNNNPLIAYFAGTPLVAIFLQFAALVGIILYTQSRRFARPLPESEPNRLSKLEYVAAMAELQQRTKAFDLAIENIYTDFHRRTARLVGVDNFTTSRENLAKLIAERAKLNFDEVNNLMFKCEDIIHGEPTNKREVLQLTSRLREIEEKLGLQRRKRR